MVTFVLIEHGGDWDSEYHEILGVFSSRWRAEEALSFYSRTNPVKKWDNSASAEFLEYEIEEHILDDFD